MSVDVATQAGPVAEEARILVVDDQPGKQMAYRAILENLDATIVIANSAREALDHLLRSDFAVVLVDVCMPELDGFELAAMIREHPRFQRTAIIFVSGVHLTDLDRLKGYQAGAVDYLLVPVVPEILRAKVSVFVDLYRKTRELERLNRELEERVAQRTAQLELADKHKNEFLAVLAHELRNPLAAIRSATHLIGAATTQPATLARCGAVIERQVGHLVHLIDDLMDVSRITRGTVELRRQPMLVADVVAQALEASRPLIDARGHVLSVDIASEPMTVDGDQTRLTQVLTNVLNNAAKFTDPGGHITVAVRRDGKDVLLRVVDTGIGISGEGLATVFELFTQGQRRLDRASGGLGIGLSLVRRLVEMHGGQVAVESEGLGCGTAVTIRLPSIPAREPGSDRRPEASLTAEVAYRVLVVDDNVDGADTLAAILRTFGHEVLTADDGVEALRVGPTFAPDVTLLDLGMPRLNGYETARHMRELPWGRNVALIALTGFGQQKDREDTLRAGFDAHLVKPVDIDELQRVLSRVAARRARRG